MWIDRFEKARFLLIRLIAIVFLVWPAVHLPLSLRLGLSPWKLGGFGMFSAPGDWIDGAIRVQVLVDCSNVGTFKSSELSVRNWLHSRNQLVRSAPVLGGQDLGWDLICADEGDGRSRKIFPETRRKLLVETIDRHVEEFMMWPRSGAVTHLSEDMAAINSKLIGMIRLTSRIDMKTGKRFVSSCSRGWEAAEGATRLFCEDLSGEASS